MTEPLRIAFEVACPVDHAFETWTTRASLWWPSNDGDEPRAGYAVTFEPRVGGRVFERTANGRETDWGEITAWEPPRRLGYLWHIMTAREHATDVEIRFTELGSDATRVESSTADGNDSAPPPPPGAIAIRRAGTASFPTSSRPAPRARDAVPRLNPAGAILRRHPRRCEPRLVVSSFATWIAIPVHHSEGACTVANYVLLYKGGGEMPSTPEGQQAAMAAWGAWFGGIGAGVVDTGNPFGPAASIAPDGSTTSGLATGYTGYSVIAADDLASAVEQSKGCPIVANGGTVEVYETFNIM